MIIFICRDGTMIRVCSVKDFVDLSLKGAKIYFVTLALFKKNNRSFVIWIYCLFVSIVCMQ